MSRYLNLFRAGIGGNFASSPMTEATIATIETAGGAIVANVAIVTGVKSPTINSRQPTCPLGLGQFRRMGDNLAEGNLTTHRRAQGHAVNWLGLPQAAPLLWGISESLPFKRHIDSKLIIDKIEQRLLFL